MDPLPLNFPAPTESFAPFLSCKFESAGETSECEQEPERETDFLRVANYFNFQAHQSFLSARSLGCSGSSEASEWAIIRAAGEMRTFEESNLNANLISKQTSRQKEIRIEFDCDSNSNSNSIPMSKSQSIEMLISRALSVNYGSSSKPRL